MKRIIRRLNNINEYVGRVVRYGIICLACVIVYEVILRYAFNNPTIWAMETSQFIFGVTMVLAAGYSLRHKQMVNMDVIYSRFSKKGRALIDVCTFIFAFIFLMALLWKSSSSAWTSLRTLEVQGTGTWNPPLYPVRLMLPIGTLLLLVELIIKFINDLVTITGRNSHER